MGTVKWLKAKKRKSKKVDDRQMKIAAVSVVMPAHNAEKTIGLGIQSVLDQTFRQIELIIVDDFSDDQTLSVVESFAEKDSRIRIRKNMRNVGAALSRNRGVEEAEYDWIAFIDSDDLWEPDKLEKQISVMENFPGYSICFTGSGFVNECGIRYRYTLNVPEKISYSELLKQNLISCSSVLAKRETLLRIPMHDEPGIHEDFATWLRILREEDFAIGINEPLLIYRINHSSKSGNKLRAARMQWRTYRNVGIHRWKIPYYFTMYSIRGFKKYFSIQKSAIKQRIK